MKIELNSAKPGCEQVSPSKRLELPKVVDDCLLLNEKGEIKIEKYQGIPVRYQLLDCLIHDVLKLSTMPKENDFSSTHSKEEKAILRKARLAKIQSLLVNDDFSVLFKSQNFDDAVAFAFIEKKYNPEELPKKLNPYTYAKNQLIGYPERYNRVFFLRKYLLHSEPPTKQLAEKFDAIEYTTEISLKEKYLMRYELMKNYDNFRDFEKKYRKLKAEAEQFLRNLPKNRAYQAFARQEFSEKTTMRPLGAQAKTKVKPMLR